MTVEEMQKFVNTIAGLYSGMTLNEAAAEHWANVCHKLPTNLAYAALRLYQKEDQYNKPPQPENIIENAQNLLMPSLTTTFQQAKAKNNYYYQRAVKEEGSVRPYHPTGAPGPTSEEMIWVEKRQEKIYNELMQECRKIPLEKMRNAQQSLDIRDKRHQKHPRLIYKEEDKQNTKVSSLVTKTVKQLEIGNGDR